MVLEVVHLVQQELIQEQVQVVVQIVKMENIQHQELLHVQHVQQDVQEIVTKQMENVQLVKLDMDIQVELVRNVLEENFQLEEQQHVNLVLQEHIQELEQEVVQLVQMVNIQQQELLHVQLVQQHVMEIVTKQMENVQLVKLDMDFQVEFVLNVQQELMQLQMEKLYVLNVKQGLLQEAEPQVVQHVQLGLIQLKEVHHVQLVMMVHIH